MTRAQFARASYARLAVMAIGLILWLATTFLPDRARIPFAEPLQIVGWVVLMSALIWQIVANLRWRRTRPGSSSRSNER